MDDLKFSHSSEKLNKENAIHVKSNAEIKLAYRELKLLFPDCDHAPMAI